MEYAVAKSKAEKLVAKMTIDECIGQLLYNSAPIERLGIKEYNWWNEALHGVARAGTATVFPQAIGLAASFNPALIGIVADVISTEGRAKYNKNVAYGDFDIYKGLTFWSPNVNLFRDPRWGRGQETFGEDPFLTATIGCEFIKGLQGEGDFLKATACAKHFAVHSGPEPKRHTFNAVVSKQDLFESYLPAFEWAVKSAGVMGVMGAYNRTNDEPCCASRTLIKEILTEKWGFKGYFVSDCGAISDIYEHHHFTESNTHSAALALRMGCHLNCGKVYELLNDAYEEDLITDEEIRQSVVRLYTIRHLLGEFEENRPYSDLPFELIDCKAHQELNLKAAQESLVLLKNEDNFLPIKNARSIGVIGPNAMNITALEGNYNGRASSYITVADGIRRVFSDKRVIVEEGCQLLKEEKNSWDGFANLHSVGLAAAKEADVTVLCLGLDRTLEGEEGGTEESENLFLGGDRCSISLPPTQQKFAEKVLRENQNVIVVVMAGSAIDLGEEIVQKAKAIVYGWYPGSVGGLAIAGLLAGEFSPSGRLPITIYKEGTLPDFEDYSMENRTYRFFKGEPRYPFGFGLCYSSFNFDNPKFEWENEDILLEFQVENIGATDSLVPVQIYAEFTDSRFRTPKLQLCGIEKPYVKAGERVKIKTKINGYWLKGVDNQGVRVTPNGILNLYIGECQPDPLSLRLKDKKALKVKVK